MGNPKLSVLVTAFDRKDFIERALLSAVNQTLERSLYEIILVGNIEIDKNFAERFQIRTIWSDIKALGPKLSLGIQECKGEIICFLDDDDEWEPQKLERVYEIFSKNPGIGYYHNGYEIINSKGEKIQSPIHLLARKKMARFINFTVDAKYASYNEIRKMVSVSGDFNGSSISVRREIVLDKLGFLEKIPNNHDAFLFYASLLSGAVTYFDPTTLTRYRVHTKNSTLVGGNFYGNKIKELRSALNLVISSPSFTDSVVHKMLREGGANKDLIKAIENKISDLQINLFWFNGWVDRLAMIKLLLNHLKFFSREDIGYFILLYLFSIFYLLFPRSGRFLYSSLYKGS